MTKLICENPERVARRAFYLAWRACHSPTGMGVFQDRPVATEIDVWDNVRNRGDYGGAGGGDKPGEVYGDYVFGRMMKLGLQWDADGVSFRADRPTRDYQAWSAVYPTYVELITAAIADLTTDSA